MYFILVVQWDLDLSHWSLFYEFIMPEEPTVEILGWRRGGWFSKSMEHGSDSNGSNMGIDINWLLKLQRRPAKGEGRCHPTWEAELESFHGFCFKRSNYWTVCMASLHAFRSPVHHGVYDLNITSPTLSPTRFRGAFPPLIQFQTANGPGRLWSGARRKPRCVLTPAEWRNPTRLGL